METVYATAAMPGLLNTECSWHFDIIHNHFYWSDETYRVFGLSDEDTVPSYRTFYNFVHPDDRKAWSEHMGLAITGRTPLNIKHRIILQTGEVRNVYLQGKLIFDSFSHPIWLSGTLRDITGQEYSIKEGGPFISVSICVETEHSIWKKAGYTVLEQFRKLTKIPDISRRGRDLTLVADIKALIDRIEVAGAIAISLDTTRFSEKRLSRKLKLSVYRVIQEQLGNIVKFSGATQARVCLSLTPEKLFLDICDNGKPVDPSQKKNGVCITDIVTCAEVNGGRAMLDALSGNGSELRVEFSMW